MKDNIQEQLKTIFLQNPELFVELIISYYTVNERIIEFIQKSPSLKYKLDWSAISRNENVNFTENFLDRYQSDLNWDLLSNNKGRFWTRRILDRFDEKLDWCGHNAFGNSMEQDDLSLSTNSGIFWSEELIEENSDKLNWWGLSRNTGLPWSQNLIDKFYDKWLWSFLSDNRGIPWSLNLLEKYESKLDWTILAGNPTLPWTISLLLNFLEKKSSWELVVQEGWMGYVNSGFLYNDSIPWDIGLKEYFLLKFPSEVPSKRGMYNPKFSIEISGIEDLKRLDRDKILNQFDFKLNSTVPWNEEMVEFLANHTTSGWEYVSNLIDLPLAIIDKHKDYLDWEVLSMTNKFIGDNKFIEKHKYRLNFTNLARNNNIIWDTGFLCKEWDGLLKGHHSDINRLANFDYSIKTIERLNRQNLPLGWKNERLWRTIEPYVDDDLVFSVISSSS